VQSRYWLGGPLGLLGVLCAGCGVRVERGEVEGELRGDGKPLANVLVTFVPDQGAGPKAVPSSGLTDAQGRFRLRAEDQREGAVVGPYRVVVEDMAVYSAPRSPDGTGLRMPPARFPARYRDPLRTPLHQQVRAGPQSVELDLSGGM